MKILAWVLFVFSCIGCLGILSDSRPDSSSLYGIVYAGLVIAFTGSWLLKEYKK